MIAPSDPIARPSTPGLVASAASASQPATVQALLRPATYPHRADDPRLHETHISWVVLAGPYAYKMKKPVDLGFLDFSTRERREQDCRAEVRLNRRLCRDVYRGVEWLVERDGAYRVGGPGRRVEPLVWMRRLPADGMLTDLLERGAADAALMRRVANRLARFHARARTGPGVDEHGSPATVRANWEENLAQIRPLVGRTLAAGTLDAIAAWGDRFLARERALLDGRVAAGRIRDGHGDLHAGSICVDGRRLHLFDCLAFAERFRCADVAAEVAFLAMDLDHHGRADLGAAFVDAYVAASGDAELARLLDLYRCYRACVRGKVLGLRLDEPTLSAEARAAVADEASAYFDLARGYAEADRPRLIAVMGLPASGKTTLARGLAGRLGLVHLSSDAARKRMVGLGPGVARPEPFGRGLYAPAMTRRTYALLRRQAAEWLRRGRGVVLDATYGDRRERAALRRLAARLGRRLEVLVCRAPEEVLRGRLSTRGPVGGIVSDARSTLWPELVGSYRPPTEVVEATTVDTTGGPAEAVRAAIAALRRDAGPIDEAPAARRATASVGTDGQARRSAEAARVDAARQPRRPRGVPLPLLEGPLVG